MGGPQGEAGLSIIAAGMSVTGGVESDGILKIEGRVQGSVRATRQVLVAKGGLVEGDVFAREAIIGGEVRGNVIATERVEIQPQSTVHGDLTTKILLVQEGGEVNGVVRMGAGVPAEATADVAG